MQRNIASLRFYLCLALVTAVAAPRAGAILQGDCDDSLNVGIHELQRCVNIHLAPPRLSDCPPCDQNGDGSVEINEVQGAANCFRNPSSLGCAMITPPPTAVPTDTATPAATNTPPVSTDTPTALPTDTPLPSATATSEPTDTATQPLPTATPTPTQGTAECGNGIEEEGESCDDGNTMDGDECPADCVVSACVPAGTTRAVDVNFQSPESLLSITLVLQYPDGTVQIPGAGTDATVGARVVNRPPGFLATFVDFDFALRGTLSGSRAFPSTRVFTVNFDECQDAPDVAAADFSCTVLEAANLSFQNIVGVTCSASLP